MEVPNLQLPAFSVWSCGVLWKMALDGVRGNAVGVISGFEGINPYSLLFAWPWLTPCRSRHNKRAKGGTAYGREIKTELEMYASAANPGFSWRVSRLCIVWDRVMRFPALSFHQQTPFCSIFCEKKRFVSCCGCLINIIFSITKLWTSVTTHQHQLR